MLWRTVRGMVPHKTKRGAAVLREVQGRTRASPSLRQGEARCRARLRRLKVLRLGAGHKYCVRGDLSHQVVWKHKATVEGLEEKRQAAASEYWAKKREANAKFAAAKEAPPRRCGDLAPRAPPPATKGLAGDV